MNRYWALADRPVPAWPDGATFVLKEAPIPVPGEGQALSRTIYVSLDPYQWGYKRRGVDAPGAACHARTVSQVVESRMVGFAPGDLVFNTNGWSEYALMGEGVPRPFFMIPPQVLDPERTAGFLWQSGSLGITRVRLRGMVQWLIPGLGDSGSVGRIRWRGSDRGATRPPERRQGRGNRRAR